jgi:hypothetical protein
MNQQSSGDGSDSVRDGTPRSEVVAGAQVLSGRILLNSYRYETTVVLHLERD